jgi:hypothetical protein
VVGDPPKVISNVFIVGTLIFRKREIGFTGIICKFFFVSSANLKLGIGPNAVKLSE